MNKCFSLLLLLLLVAYKQINSQQVVNENINEISKKWETYWNGKDLEKIIELYSEDAVFLPDNGERYEGRKAIKDLFAQALELINPNIELTSIVSGLSGDLAYDSGSYTENPTGSENNVNGNYLIVFKKEHGGKWLIIQHMWSQIPKLPGK
jgi:uncharacterized protein (TIGR02246 family)